MVFLWGNAFRPFRLFRAGLAGRLLVARSGGNPPGAARQVRPAAPPPGLALLCASRSPVCIMSGVYRFPYRGVRETL